MIMEEEPTLQDVLDLGGTEEDFALLQEEDGGSEVGNISQNEISNFISKIGLIPGQWMDDIKKDEGEEDNNREDKNKIRDKDQLKMRQRVDVKNDEDDKIQQGIKRDEKMTENVAIMKLTSTKKQANEKLKLHPQQQQPVPSHEMSSLIKTKKKKKSQNLSETTPIQTTQLDLSPDQSSPTQFNSLLDPLSLNKILSASDTEDLTKLSSMGVVELVAATRDLEEKLLQLSATEHTKIYIPLDNCVPWFEDSNSEIGTMLVSQEVQNHLHTLAGQVMTSEVKLYQKTREKRKGHHDVQWLKTILTSGTLSDKMAAMTLIVQESPVHSLSTIENFISMSSKRSKRESILAIDTFKGLVISDILPENRKLKYLKQRPLEKLLITRGQGEVSCDQHKLLLWYFEDRLKDKYFRYVTLLKELLHDPVSEIREKITGVVFDLLYNRPEQEQLLLKLIVNKLGDPNRRIASKSILLLLKLLNHHVNMKLVVVREIEKLLHRPNVQPKTQYYTICFLNQIVIGPSDQLLPQKLVSIYFSFFKTYIDKSEFDSKILSALLTGVNRALPYLKVDVPSLEDHLNSLFKIVHVGPLATSVQSLALLYQVMEKRQAVSSRYYRALYQKLMDTQLSLRTGQQAMFLNLLYKSLKSDPELNRNKAFLKRILQSCDYHMPHFVCGCLLIISEVLKTKPALWAYILQPEIGNEEEIFHDVDEAEEGEGEEAITMEETTAIEDIVEGYRMKHREPLYCRAEISCLWELARLTHHFHPSVQVFANKIASGNLITYDGDPLNDFTTIQFLDHFVHKNPKQKVSDHGGSVMQPIGNLLKTEVYTLPRSMSDLATMEEEKVRTDLLFIHKFMKRDFEMNRLKYDETIKKKRRRKKFISLSDEEEEEKKETSDNDNTNEDNPDFAGEFTKQVKIKQEQKIKEKRKKKSARDSDDNDEDFSYSDMSSSDFEEDHDISVDNSNEDDDNKVTTKEDVEEAQLEKMLLENLSSSSDDETETSISRKRERENEFDSDRKKKKMDHSSVFASADEFAYLLEESEEKPTTFLKKKKTGAKEQGWEEKRASGYHGWSQIKRDFRGKSYRRGTSRGGFRGRVKGLTGEKIQGSGRGRFRGGSRERGGGGFRGASCGHDGGGFRGASHGRDGGGFRGASRGRGGGGFRGGSRGRGGRGFRGGSRGHDGGGFRGASRGRGGRGFRGGSHGHGGVGFRGGNHGYDDKGPRGHGFRGGSHGPGEKRGFRGRGKSGFSRGSHGGFKRGSRGRGRV